MSVNKSRICIKHKCNYISFDGSRPTETCPLDCLIVEYNEKILDFYKNQNKFNDSEWINKFKEITGIENIPMIVSDIKIKIIDNNIIIPISMFPDYTGEDLKTIFEHICSIIFIKKKITIEDPIEKKIENTINTFTNDIKDSISGRDSGFLDKLNYLKNGLLSIDNIKKELIELKEKIIIKPYSIGKTGEANVENILSKYFGTEHIIKKIVNHGDFVVDDKILVEVKFGTYDIGKNQIDIFYDNIFMEDEYSVGVFISVNAHISRHRKLEIENIVRAGKKKTVLYIPMADEAQIIAGILTALRLSDNKEITIDTALIMNDKINKIINTTISSLVSIKNSTEMMITGKINELIESLKKEK